MSLRAKVAVYICTVFMVSSFIILAVHLFILFPGLERIERRHARQNVDRIKKAVKKELSYLDSLCHDWSAWNETYDFAVSQTNKYRENNLGYHTYSNNRLNLITVINRKGRIIYSQVWDLNSRKQLGPGEFTENRILKEHPLVSFARQGELSEWKVSGIYMGETGPVFVSARPVLTSDNRGPRQGTLIFGRFFDRFFIQDLVNQTQVDFTLINITGEKISPSVRPILQKLSSETPYYFQKKDKDILFGYSLLRDIEGKKALLVKASISREITARGAAALRLSLVLTFVSALVSLLVLVWILNKNIAGPLARLTDHVLAAGENGTRFLNPIPDRHDEIGALAVEFERMVLMLERRAEELLEANEDLKRDITIRRETEKKLRESEERFRILHDASFGGIGIHDDGIILDANKTLAEMTGYEFDELLGMDGLQLIAPRWREMVREKIRSGDENPYDVEGLKKDGTVFPLEVQGKAIPYYGRTVRITESRDITLRKKVEEELKRVHRELTTIFENGAVGIMFLRGGRYLVRANKRALELLGFSSMEEAKGLSMRKIHVSKERYNEFGRNYYDSLLSGEMIRVEYELKRRDGTVFWANLSGRAIDSNAPPDLDKGVVWMFDDITEKKKNEEKLRELAVKDPLTGIFNRRYFMEQGKVEFERQRRYGQGLSIIMIDIDRFKSVNDRYGHDVGDRVLAGFTKLGSAIVRESDIFARLGGEEFAVLLPATALADACVIAERLRKAQEKERVVTDGEGLVVTLSCGVFECEKDVESFENMVKMCDIALYRAKAQGRNRVVCTGSWVTN